MNTPPTRRASPILMPCAKHKRLPDTTVCSACLAEMGEWSKTTQETLTVMPKVFQELHEEGMRYFRALDAICNAEDVCTCGINRLSDHLEDCPQGIALTALSGHEKRILHRPATGKAALLAEQALNREAFKNA